MEQVNALLDRIIVLRNNGIIGGSIVMSWMGCLTSERIPQKEAFN